MIVIGADTHKGSHALAAAHEGTGKVRASREIEADDGGHLPAVRWARRLDDERVWAIEDCRHVSRRFEQALLAAGERVVRVPPHRMGASRKGERGPGKSDEIDALEVARAVGKDGVDGGPLACTAARRSPTNSTSSLARAGTGAWRPAARRHSRAGSWRSAPGPRARPAGRSCAAPTRLLRSAARRSSSSSCARRSRRPRSACRGARATRRR
jgi:Transposase